jgi:ABC-type transport system involved in multi-copper enzyme maturation permease subunit
VSKTLIITAGVLKDSIRQPVYYFLIIFFSLLILTTRIITTFGFGFEINMIREMGISSVTLCGLLISILASPGIISEDIRDRTILVVFAKPVSKMEFILGKYIGIMLAILCAFFFLTPAFGLTLWWKGDVLQYGNIIKTIILSYESVAIITAISLTLSIFLPIAFNAVVCFFVYAAGHLSPYVCGRLIEKGGISQFAGNVIYSFLPNLENFNVSSALAVGTHVPNGYVAITTFYCMMYTGIVLFLATTILEKKEVY